MKIELRVVDTKENKLGLAELTVFLVLKSGQKKKFGPWVTDADGVVKNDEYKNEIILDIDYINSQYVISQKGKTTGRLPLEEPKRVSSNLFLYTLVAKGIGEDNSQQGKPDPVKDEGFLVQGFVAGEGEEPLPNMIVRAFDRGLGQQAELGTAQTGENGRYRIDYTPELFAEDKKTSDLIVKLFDSGNLDEPVAVSGLIVNAGLKETVDFTTSIKPWRGVSLYLQLLHDTKPLLKGKPATALEVEDIALLASRTGHNTMALAHFVRAWDIVDELGLPKKNNNVAAAFFGWAAGGIEPNVSAILGASDDKLRRLLVEARNSNWIPVVNVDQILVGMEKLRKSRPADDSDLVKILNTIGVAQNKFGKVISITLAEMDDIKKWQRISKLIGSKKQLALRNTIEIWRTLQHDATLTINLISNEKIIEPAELTLLSRSQLIKAISRGNEMPSEIPGDDQRARMQNYAQSLLEMIELSYPHDHFVRNLMQSRVKVASERANQIFLRKEIRLDESKSLRKLASDDASQLAELATLYLVSPKLGRAKAAEKLMADKIVSSSDILARNREQFRSTMGAKLGNANADAIYLRASHLGSMSTTLDLRETDQNDETPNTLVGQLFKGAITEGCNPCRSIFSPSAYLLDLFKYVARANVNGVSGTDILRLRRPDLFDLRLDCANTETVLPYIDLALEVLEDAVSPWEYTPRQTSWPADRLAAEPEYVNNSTYNELKTRRFPWMLPFDREMDRTTAYLKHLGTSLADLRAITDINNSSQSNRLNTAAVSLGVASHKFITVGSQAKWLINWGVRSSDQLREMSTIRVLSSWLHLQADDVVALFDASFVNPTGKALVQQDGTIYWSRINDSLLERMQFIGRLFCQTQFTIEQLNSFFELDVIAVDSSKSWLLELAAVSKLIDILASTFEAVVQVWSIGASSTREKVSALFAVELPLLEGFIGLSIESNPSKPTELLDLAISINQLTDSGIEMVDAVGLLSISDSEGRFSIEINQKQIDILKETLVRVTRPEDIGDLDQRSVYLLNLLQVVADQLSDSWELDSDLLSQLLSQNNNEYLLKILAACSIPLQGETETSAETDMMDAVKLAMLSKLAFVLGQGQFSVNDLPYISLLRARTKWPDIRALPVVNSNPDLSLPDLFDLLEHQRLNLLYFADGESLFARMASSSDVAQLTNNLVAAPPWSDSNISYLLGSDGFDFSGKIQFLNKKGVVVCGQLLALAKHLKIDAESTWALTAATDGSTAQEVLKSNITEESYYNTLAQLNDPMRERQRDVLLQSIITDSRNNGQVPEFKSSLDVYEYFLIDPEMGACFDTARVKQACASLQQFTQRILLGLEEDASFTPDDQKQWVWRKNYRVWEANRKVFLYPENWIEPELRDNKTALYEQLESELLQGEVTEESSENSIMQYARGLHSLSRLEMVATLEDETNGSQHVFARSSDLPKKYYWCTRGSNGLWAGWLPIDIEIDTEHFLPTIYEGRLFIFWAQLVEKIDNRNATYMNELAALEAEEEQVSSSINELSRRIDDLTKEEEKYRKQANTSGFGFADLFNGLADFSATRKLKAENDYNYLVLELPRIKNKKSMLTLSYTYLECSLNWSQYHRLSGWRAMNRSDGAVDTIYTNEDGNEIHERFSSRIWLRARHMSEVLHLELRTKAAREGENVFDYRLGNFSFDPIQEAISVKDESIAVKLRKEDYFPTMPHQSQKLSGMYWTPYLDINVDGKDIRLANFNTEVSASVFPEEKVGFNPARSGFLFSSSNRSYYFEPINPIVGRSILDRSLLEQPDKPSLFLADRPIATASLFKTEGETKAVLPDVFGSGPIRTATRPPGMSSRVIRADSVNSQIVQDKAPVQAGEWRNIQKILQSDTATIPDLVGNLSTGQTWRATVFYHPFTSIIVAELYRRGLDGLYAPDIGSGNLNANKLYRQKHEAALFDELHMPTKALSIASENEELFDFNRVNPYSLYNWEMFFHAPLAIARQLTRNRKYEEARRWLHFIFDPINKTEEGQASFWRFGPFYKEHQRIQAGETTDLENISEEDFAQFEAQVAEWENNPFNPHAIARLRSISYMRATFIAYIDNLMQWADELFRRDTMEFVAEAAQLYIHVAQLLGPAPLKMPDVDEPDRAASVEDHLAGVRTVQPLLAASSTDSVPAETVPTDFFTLFGEFCIPTNGRLMEYWDTLADRLFKIRHCMNIEGLERSLALYQPPIDPALLVRAAAAGVDIGSAIAGLFAPRPHYRFSFMLQKAMEFTADVRSLGASVLSALEKNDAEELSKIRASHEVSMARRLIEIRKDRLSEAKTAYESLEKFLLSVKERRDYYQDLIDEGVLPQEKNEQLMLGLASSANIMASVSMAIASVTSAIPESGTNGPVPTISIGGQEFGTSGVFGAISHVSTSVATSFQFGSNLSARSAVNTRREMEWNHLKDQASREIERLEKDQIASEIRIAISEKEISDQELQIKNSEEAELFLKGKFTNSQLYGWMVTQLSGLHFQSFQLALDLAKQAETCMRTELDDSSGSFIDSGHWDSLKKGLLAGERLTLDLRRLEAYYLANNQRRLELNKNISLVRLDPKQLLELRSSGSCEFSLPEYIFDLDHPGHYRRRIKSVAMSIPAIAGPYTTIGCTLQLLDSEVRMNPDESEQMSKQPVSYSIATSSGQSDSGLFQFDFRDERYLPFEGAGVISNWKLDLPKSEIAQFDYHTITDVLLHVNYTALSDESYRTVVESSLSNANLGLEDKFFIQLLSLRQNFSDQWTNLANTNASEDGSNGVSDSGVEINLKKEHFPYFTAIKTIKLEDVTLIPKVVEPSMNEPEMLLKLDEKLLGAVTLTAPGMLSKVGMELSDVYLLFKYSLNSPSRTGNA